MDLSLAGAMMLPFIAMIKIESEIYLFETNMKPLIDSFMEGLFKHDHECEHS